MGKYSREVFEEILRLYDSGKTYQNILSSLKARGLVGPKMNLGGIAQMHRHAISSVSDVPTDPQEVMDSAYEDARAAFETFISRTNTPLAKNTRAGKKNRILTISDTHVPFHDKEKILKAFNDSGANILVIAGDLMNGDAISDHIKVVHQDFQKEIAETTVFLEECSKRFDEVWILDGNHDKDRWTRLIAKSARSDVAAFLLASFDPLDYITKGLGNVFRASKFHESNELYPQFAKELGHTLIIGDCLWSHLTLTGKDGESVRKVESWYRSFKPVFNWPEVRIFQQGHTHQLSANFENDSVVIQTGCMVKMDGLVYSLASHGKSKAPVWGYTVIDQVDGITQKDSIRLVWL